MLPSGLKALTTIRELVAENMNENYITNFKQQLLERLLKANPNDLVLVDECLLSDLWVASDEELKLYPNIKFSYAKIIRWCADNDLAGWKPVEVVKSDSEHHNFSTGQKFFRPMAFKFTKGS